MPPSAEALLVLVIAGFFLKDSVMLLARDEAVLVRGFGGRWSAGFGARHWRLFGKEPYLCNPLTPHAPVFRLRWRESPSEAAASTSPGLEVPPALARLGGFVWITWLAMFAVLPTLLLLRVTGPALIGAVVLVYASIAASLVATWRWRAALGIERKPFAMLAFECVVCAPYAANLVRRVAALRQVDEDMVAASTRLLDASRLDAVKRECLARIDERIESEPAEGDAAARLRAARVRFVVKEPDESS